MKESNMIKRMAIAAVAALALTGCATPAHPSIQPSLGATLAPSGSAPADLTAVAGRTALKTLPAAATRHLMEAPGSTATLWGIDYKYAYEDIRRVLHYRPSEDILRPNGRIYHRKSRRWYEDESFGWRTEWNRTGDGEFTMMDGGRFLYKVPFGRVLVVSRVLYPGRVTINGFSVGWGARETKDVLDQVNYVFGPGEIVQFAFPTTRHDAKNANWVNCNAKISGFTADPALFGGSAMPTGLGFDLGPDGMAK